MLQTLVLHLSIRLSLHLAIKGLRDLFLQTLDASLQRQPDIFLLSLHLLRRRVSLLNVLLQAADGQSYELDTKSLTKMMAQTETGALKVFAQYFLAQNDTF